MISIDRNAKRPVHEQLVEQLRYLIATGQYRVGETLPSTRVFGEQLGVSFHTVRKAYQQLEKEGLVQSRVGSGFTVRERVPLQKGQRMEQGAAILQESLQRLIGLGLAGEELEYLFQEQMGLLEGEAARNKILFAAPYRELADTGAHQIAVALQQPVDPVTLGALHQHLDADYVLTGFPHLHRVREVLPRAEVAGILTYLSPETLGHIAGLSGHHTLGLVTRHVDAIGPMTIEIKSLSGFSGQLIATSIESGSRQLETFLPQTDLLLYTPGCRRTLVPYLNDDRPHAPLAHVVSRDSIAMIRQFIPG